MMSTLVLVAGLGLAASPLASKPAARVGAPVSISKARAKVAPPPSPLDLCRADVEDCNMRREANYQAAVTFEEDASTCYLRLANETQTRMAAEAALIPPSPQQILEDHNRLTGYEIGMIVTAGVAGIAVGAIVAAVAISAGG